MGQVEEEGPVLGFAEEFHRAVGAIAGDRELAVGFHAADDLVVFHQGQRRLAVASEAGVVAWGRGGLGRRGQRLAGVALGAIGGRAHVVRVGDAVEGVEALPGGEKFRLVAEVPLADAGGGVAGFLEDFGEGHFVRVQAERGGGEEHVGKRERAFRVAAGQQRGARGRADRGGVVAGQLAAFLGHPVEVRGAVVGTEWADVRVAEVVDVDDDEVRFLRGSCERSEERGGKQDEGSHGLSIRVAGFRLFLE